MNRAKLVLAAAMLTVTLAAAPATAQISGGYLGVGGGAGFLTDSDLNGTGLAGSIDYDTDFLGWIAGGYGFGNGIRTELEFSYRDNDADTIGGAAATGDTSATSVMVNLLYDFAAGERFLPYVGVGIGGSNVEFHGVAPVAGSVLDDSSVEFAFQGLAGVAYALSDSVYLTADYRFFGTTDPGGRTNAGLGVNTDYLSHAVTVGIRFLFGAKPEPAKVIAAAPPPPPAVAPEPEPAPEPVQQPAPAPAPPPAPEPAVVEMPRTYLVFFDWDQAVLTPEARSIVTAAADNAKSGQIARLVLTGHADRSGPARYNLGLSMRRAQSVRNELVRLGIAPAAIALFARGETDPLVPTPDGVREPQNRRVEIVFE